MEHILCNCQPHHIRCSFHCDYGIRCVTYLINEINDWKMGLGNAERSGAFSSVKEGNAPGVAHPPLLLLRTALCLTGEEWYWSRIDEIKCWHCPVATTFYTAKLAGIVILQGYTELPRNNPQNLTLRIKFGLSFQDGFFRSSLDRRITNSPRS